MSSSQASSSAAERRPSLSITAATMSPASIVASARWSRPESSPSSTFTASTNASTYLSSTPGTPAEYEAGV